MLTNDAKYAIIKLQANTAYLAAGKEDILKQSNKQNSNTIPVIALKGGEPE